jgi:hypothetical protein
MEWNKAKVGDQVRATRKLYITADEDGSKVVIEVPVGAIGLIRGLRPPGNSMVPAVQVEWQVVGTPLYWCAGYEVALV